MRINVSPRAVEFEASDDLDMAALDEIGAFLLTNGYESLVRNENKLRCNTDGEALWARLAGALESGVLVAPVKSIVYAHDLSNLLPVARRADTPF